MRRGSQGIAKNCAHRAGRAVLSALFGGLLAFGMLPGEQIVQVMAATSVSGVSFVATPTTPSQTSDWQVDFTTTTGNATSVTITVPNGTVLPTTRGAYYIKSNLTGGSWGDYPSGPPLFTGTNEVTLTLPYVLAQGVPVGVSISGVTNPPAGNEPASDFSVATSADPAPANPAVGIDFEPTAVSGVSFAADPTTPGATSTWTVGFTPAVTGATTVTIGGPEGTVFPSAASDYNISSGWENNPSTVVADTYAVTLTLANSDTLSAGSAATVSISGMTNPSIDAPASDFSVSTSQDAATVHPANGINFSTSVTSVSPSVGPADGGTWVLITGTNLDGATGVRFGGTAAASFTVDSPTQISAQAPPGAGAVDVTVTTAGGASAQSAGDHFTYQAGQAVAAIAASGYDGYALMGDGTVQDWGFGLDGQLGNGASTMSSATPVKVSGLTGVASIAGGYALKSDGTVWAWGANGAGQLGDGSTSSSNVPVQVSNLSGIRAIVGTTLNGYALKSDGTVWAWGDNTDGQMGNGTTTASSTPVQVSGLSGIVAIAAEAYDGYALKSDGTVWSWGHNNVGQLGDGTTTDSTSPVQVSGLTGVVSIAAGGAAYAIKSDGTVWAWGDNTSGMLGDGQSLDVSDSTTPLQVWHLNGSAMIGAGSDAAYALNNVYAGSTDGSVWSWGANVDGQLGYSTSAGVESVNAATQISGLTGVVELAGNQNDGYALKSDGTVYSFGDGTYGQLGNGSTTSSDVPVEVSLQSTKLLVSASPASVAADGKQAVTVTATVCGAGNTPESGVSVSFSSDIGTFSHATVSTDGNGQAQDQMTSTQAGTATVVVSAAGVSNGTSVTFTAVSPTVMTVAAGGDASYLLKSDGTVWAWGDNSTGEMGPSGSGSQSNVPVQVAGLSGVIAIAGGGVSGYALENDGTVWAWGGNAQGELGNGSTSSSQAPVQVSGLTGVTAIAAGMKDAYALKSDGTVWAWGYNGNGELGDGSQTDRDMPSQVSGLTGVTAIGAAGYSGYAVKSDGTVWAWGYNNAGQLGDATTTNSTTPVQVQNLTGILAVAGSMAGGYALKSDGTVWAWGGTLGNGSTADSSVPVQVSGLSNVMNIAGGLISGYAREFDGTVWAWGNNGDGQLGNGSQTDSSVPVQVSGISNATAIAAAGRSALALSEDGVVWAWGSNAQGQLGTSLSGYSTVPVSGINLSAPTVTAVSPTSGFRTGGTKVTISGTNFTGAEGVDFGGAAATNVTVVSSTEITATAPAGSGTVDVTVENVPGGTSAAGATDQFTYDTSVTPLVVGFGGGAVSANDTCLSCIQGGGFALKSDGTVWAWGDNTRGELGPGAGSILASYRPVQVLGLTGVTALAGGESAGYALKFDGTVWAWGGNDAGQLGDNSTTDSPTPVQVSGLSDVTAISASMDTAYALKSDGTVWAWGNNVAGELGSGSSMSSSPVPVQVSGLTGVVAISGNYALKSDGTVWAWGVNVWGELGNGSSAPSSNTPVQVQGLTGVTAIAGGSGFNGYALKSDGTVWSWGYNLSGMLGDGKSSTESQSNVPVQVSRLTGVTAIAAIDGNGYALKSDGTLWAWGDTGALGDGSVDQYLYQGSDVPVQVSGITGATAVAGGASSTAFAETSDGKVWAWGDNTFGQLGNESAIPSSPVPVAVADLLLAAAPDGSLVSPSSGPANGGTVVDITGTDFTDVTGVRFGGRQALGFTVDSPTEITAVSPPSPSGTGAVDVVISTVSGASPTGAWDQFSYGAATASAPTLTAVSPAGGPEAGGTQVVITGTDFTDAERVYFGGNMATFTVDSSTQITATAPAGTGTVAVIVTSTSGGASATGAGDNFSYYGPKVVAVAAGEASSDGYAIRSDGTVWSWGDNSQGELGGIDSSGYVDKQSPTPIEVSGLSGVRDVAAGGLAAMAVKSDGTVWLWGLINIGSDSYNDYVTYRMPAEKQGLSGVTAVATTGDTYYALKSDGTVWAWGSNGNGALGTDTQATTDSTPKQVSGLSHVVAIAAADGGATYALEANGTVWAWGDNYVGELGNGTQVDSGKPVQVSNLTDVIAIAAGGGNGYALKSDGTVWAWGINDKNEVGTGTQTYNAKNELGYPVVTVPVQVSGVAEIAAIGPGGYALKSDGTVWTWGDNEYGQYGNGSTTSGWTAVKLADLAGITAIAGSGGTRYALAGDGTVWAWGQGQDGELGNATTSGSSRPVKVAFIPPLSMPTPAPTANGRGTAASPTQIVNLPQQQTTTTVEETVDASAQSVTVATLGNTVVLNFPKESLPSQTQVDVAPATNAPNPPQGTDTVIAPLSISTGGVEPTAPVTLTMTLPKGVSYQSDMAIYTLVNGKWSIYSMVSPGPTGNTVTVTIPHFSIWAVMAIQTSFSDVPNGDWAYPYVEELAARGAVTGYPGGHFDPAAPVTRAEFLAMLVRALALTAPAEGSSPFPDVREGAWYAPYFLAMYAKGYIHGDHTGKAHPGARITRQEAAAIIYRLLGSPQPQGVPTTFGDQASIGAWAVAAVHSDVAAGILQGKPDGMFEPLGSLQRDEAAAMIVRLIHALAAQG